MKRMGAVFSLFAIGIFCALVHNYASADEARTHWDGHTKLTEIGDISEQQVNLPYFCETMLTGIAKLKHPVANTLSEQFYDIYSEHNGQNCVVTNNQGRFITEYTATYSMERHEANHYSPSEDQAKFLKWHPSKGVTNWYDPAPQGNTVLELKRGSTSDKAYQVTVHKNIREWGKLSSQNRDVVWTVDTESLIERDAVSFAYGDGGSFVATLHRFSPNGRFLLIRNGEGLVLVDLVDNSRKLVYLAKNSTRPTDFAVSSDGKFIALTTAKNELEIIDTSDCEINESYGLWQRKFVLSSSKQGPYPGCRSIKDFKTDLAVADLFTVSAQIKGLYFSPVGDKLHFSVKRDAYTAENPVHEYSWKAYELTAEEYVSTAAGYLAMGDSYSSGEGDNQGGDWYELGTDEQGDADTFAGRNLCHLSRRSYPYLIALELGYLEKNSESPPADGLFHSVACSGAKIHNIVGGDLGERHTDGSSDDFARTDNQYRYNDEPLWHPGYTKQVNSLTNKILESEAAREFVPEVVTLGIGGNDAGFGDFLQACTGKGVTPGTCEFAEPGRDKSVRLGVAIAQQKQRLASTYMTIKESSPGARIYVHGYPHFVRGGGGSCGVNVRLDEKERAFATRATTYMNEIVEAAAQEAGVVYVDVTNIFDGGKLCDEGEKYVNGVTKGNDVGFGAKIIGNESFHPNAKGFERYKKTLLDQSNKFTKPMPTVTVSQIPLPSADLFGEEAVEIIQNMNNQDTATPEYSNSGLSTRETGENTYELEQDGFYPGSNAELEVHSTPISLGSFVADSTGKVSASFSLPDLEPGYHELHLKGFDRFGRAIDVFETFIVAFSAEDFDGDGIKDADDKCPGLPDTNLDNDNDGIDDGCDPEIVVTSTSQPKESDPLQKVIDAVAGVSTRVANIANNLVRVANQNVDTIPRDASLKVEEDIISEGETLASITSGNPPSAVKQSEVSVQWWLIALSVSFIGAISIIIKKVAYAKTN